MALSHRKHCNALHNTCASPNRLVSDPKRTLVVTAWSAGLSLLQITQDAPPCPADRQGAPSPLANEVVRKQSSCTYIAETTSIEP